jgi:hypothetical protein
MYTCNASARTPTHAHTDKYTHVYINPYSYTYICMPIYLCTHTHTGIRTYTPPLSSPECSRELELHTQFRKEERHEGRNSRIKTFKKEKLSGPMLEPLSSFHCCPHFPPLTTSLLIPSPSGYGPLVGMVRSSPHHCS